MRYAFSSPFQGPGAEGDSIGARSVPPAPQLTGGRVEPATCRDIGECGETSHAAFVCLFRPATLRKIVEAGADFQSAAFNCRVCERNFVPRNGADRRTLLNVGRFGAAEAAGARVSPGAAPTNLARSADLLDPPRARAAPRPATPWFLALKSIAYSVDLMTGERARTSARRPSRAREILT